MENEIEGLMTQNGFEVFDPKRQEVTRLDTQVIDDLILDTLYYRRVPPGGSSFASNVAGLELIQCDSVALPRIEHVVRESIAPKSTTAIPDEFLGLDYLLGAYAIIGAKHDPNRAIGFVRTLPTPLQVATIGILPIFFAKDDDTYNFGVPPSRDFLAFVRDAQGSDVEAISTAAKRAATFLGV
jgi:hypothetical protein